MVRSVAILIFIFLSLQGFSQDSDRPKQPDLPGDLMLDFGFNIWTDEPDLLPTKFIGSNSFGIYYNRRLKLSDHFSLNAALGFSLEKLAFDGRNNWFRSSNNEIALDSLSDDLGLRKNKLRISYFEIPFELRIHPLGTVNGEGFFIGLGGIGGVRIGARTKVKYDIGDDTHKEQLYGQFDLNRWKYGVQARLGFKTFHVFYKMYFSDQFSSAPYDGSSNPRMMTIGVNFSGF